MNIEFVNFFVVSNLGDRVCVVEFNQYCIGLIEEKMKCTGP